MPTSQFNIYDVIGYFIPGAILTGLIVGVGWYLGIVDIPGSVITFLIPVAYVVGMLLNVAMRRFVTVNRRGSPGSNPAIRVLDSDDNTFTNDFKGRLCKKILDSFGLENLDTPNQKQMDSIFAMTG